MSCPLWECNTEMLQHPFVALHSFLLHITQPLSSAPIFSTLYGFPPLPLPPLPMLPFPLSVSPHLVLLSDLSLPLCPVFISSLSFLGNPPAKWHKPHPSVFEGRPIHCSADQDLKYGILSFVEYRKIIAQFAYISTVSLRLTITRNAAVNPPNTHALLVFHHRYAYADLSLS